MGSEDRDGMSEGRPDSASENYDTMGNDGPGFAGKPRNVVVNTFQDTLCRCRDRTCGRSSVPYGGPSLTNEGHEASMTRVLQIGVVVWHVVVGRLT